MEDDRDSAPTSTPQAVAPGLPPGVQAPSRLEEDIPASEMPTAPEAGKSLRPDDEDWVSRTTRRVPAPPPAIDVGATVGGKYRLEALLGSGGMGRVFEGVHIELDSRVAVKVMHPYILNLPEHSRRFRREARAASRINHPNVVRVLDFGIDNDTHFIVMEYVVGTTLGAWLETFAQPPPLADVYDIGEQMLSGLDAAHLAGVVHRDLKPENILLTTNEQGFRTVKIADFGLARYQDPEDQGASFTRDDTIAGTPGYMSPEQCRSLKVEASSDLYAFGCILTEMLQLDPPFIAETAIDVISKQLYMPPGPLLRPFSTEAIPDLLETLRLDLLSKVPDQRPRSAEEVIFRLRECLSPEAAEKASKRKRASPVGIRGDRVPDWNRNGQTEATATSEREILVQLVRQGVTGGLRDSELVGLVMQGILTQTEPPEAKESAPVALVDAGPDRAYALQALERLVAEGRSVVVCIANPSQEDLNNFIEQGASEVVALPAAGDALARRIKRAAKKLAQRSQVLA